MRRSLERTVGISDEASFRWNQKISISVQQIRDANGSLGMTFGKRNPKPFENRREFRTPTNLNGIIVLDGGQEVRCLIKDISAQGALLIVESVLGIPPRFDLRLGSGQARRAQVQWRGLSRVGVMFV